MEKSDKKRRIAFRPHFSAVVVALLTFAISSGYATPPTSAEQLRAEVESALKAKDTNAFTTLFNWQDVSEDMK
jgi:hypothetical protein